MKNDAIWINSTEGILSHPIDFWRAETATKNIIEEEIMKLVRAHKVFCLLSNFSLIICWLQLWWDWSLHDVNQCFTYIFILSRVGSITHKILYQRLWHTRIHGIHAHVVAIIGTPTQGKFAKVARTDDKSVHLITQIHQNLRTLTCLCILISRIMYLWIVIYILKMLQNRSLNVNLTNSNTKIFHQCNSILIGSARCSESWHSNTYDSFTVKPKLVKGFDNNKEGKRGIKSTTDANNGWFTISMY